MIDRNCVKVIHGANSNQLDVVGETIERVQASGVEALNVSKSALAFANGKRVPYSYRLQSGDVLEFIERRGRKGAGRITEKDLSKLGLHVVGDQVVRVDQTAPDASWGIDRLVAYVKTQLAVSDQLQKDALLQSNKSAVALFWAGCALFFVREQSKSQKRGNWEALKREQGWADTTVNDAIRLFQNAKTPDALSSLGVTEAKEKYVYPFKEKDNQSKVKTGASSPKAKASGSVGKSQLKPKVANSAADDDEAGDDEGSQDDQDEIAAEVPKPTLVEELNNIAQRLIEIALDDLGKVDVIANKDSIHTAIRAVEGAISQLYDELNRRLPNAGKRNHSM